MKLLLAILCLAALGFAADNGCTELSSGHNVQPTDDVVLTVLNDWPASSGLQILGIDVFEDGGNIYVLGADATNDYVQAWDGISGGALGTMSLDAANTSCFSIVWNDDPDTDTYYTDDWGNSNLFYTENFGSSWTTTANPAGSSGRGTAFDGTDYWITNGSGGGLWRFQPGIGQENLAIPEVPSQPSGVAVFPYMGDLAVAVTAYNDHLIWFYIYDGSSLTFHGSAACPVAVSNSMGLAYSATNGHLYWSYYDGSLYHLVELEFDLTSLSRDTWAGIKTAF